MFTSVWILCAHEILEEIKFVAVVVVVFKETGPNSSRSSTPESNISRLTSSDRSFKILKNEIKIIEISQALLEIFNFKD